MAEVSIHITVDNAGAFQQIITPLDKLRGTMEALNRTGSALSGTVVQTVESLNEKIGKLSKSMEDLAKSTDAADKPGAERILLVEKVALFVFLGRLFRAVFLKNIYRKRNEISNTYNYEDYSDCFSKKIHYCIVAGVNPESDDKEGK